MIINGSDIDEHELSELWHTALIVAHDRYGRMVQAAKWYAEAHPDVPQIRAYKALDRMLI